MFLALHRFCRSWSLQIWKRRPLGVCVCVWARLSHDAHVTVDLEAVVQRRRPWGPRPCVSAQPVLHGNITEHLHCGAALSSRHIRQQLSQICVWTANEVWPFTRITAGVAPVMICEWKDIKGPVSVFWWEIICSRPKGQNCSTSPKVSASDVRTDALAVWCGPHQLCYLVFSILQSLGWDANFFFRRAHTERTAHGPRGSIHLIRPKSVSDKNCWLPL